MTNDDDRSTWAEYSKLVLSELRRLDSSIERISTSFEKTIAHESRNRRMIENATSAELQRLALEVQSLKIKAGVWGAMAGLIPVLVAVAMKSL